MNKATSAYLDFLRVIAAFGVVLVHANLSWFSNGLFLPEQLGHKLVMIFFVLSGYLIAFTVHEKNKGAKRYLVDRLSRLYSVVLPALVFTYVLDSIGKYFHPGFYIIQLAPDHQIIRFFLNATFLSQIWGLSTKPSSNGPFWSISYEFWYYMLFWAYCYLKGKKRYIGLIIICLITGIKILILFPVWVFGVIAYRLSVKFRVAPKFGLMLFVISLVLIVVLTFLWDFSVFSKVFVFGRPPLFFSSRFVFDWIYGFVIAINLFAVSHLRQKVVIPALVINSIKNLSAMTFSLYLYHLPLLIFIAAFIDFNKSSYIQIIPLLVAVILIVNILSKITENQRDKIKLLINRFLDSVRIRTKNLV